MRDRRHFRPSGGMVLAIGLACLGSGGCLGPAAVKSTRLKYNDVVRATNDEQLLINLVRLRYADSPIFIDLPNITSQFEVAGVGGYNGGYGNQYKGPTSLGTGQLTLRDTPTLSYHPREGRELAKGLLSPLSADLFSVVSAGGRLDQLFWLTLNDINDVPNSSQGTILIPQVGDDNSRFLRGVRLLARIDDQGGAELGFATQDEDENASDPIPSDAIQGRDLVEAAAKGYAFRDKAKGKMTLVKREKELTLKIRPEFRNSPEMDELAEIFHLTPGLGLYRIRSELQPGAERSPPDALPAGDTINVNLRSVLQIMTFLSKGVCVPEEHVRTGEAPSVPGPDGRPFDWTRLTRGNFFVGSQKRKPRESEVAVFYRDYWFYISKQDPNSRSVLAILEILFSLQESDDKPEGPVLTLPTR